MKKTLVHIGCSGWNYPHWEKVFYPEGLGRDNRFREYSRRFRTVEVNNTFYHLPDEAVFRKWRDQAPEGFIYAIKASRYITHMKKLKDPADPVKHLFARASLLEEKLGPVLFQLPPRWKVNQERLNAFTDVLPEGNNYVFEFRDSSWYDARIYRILEAKGMSMCLHDMTGSASPDVTVGPLCYIRLHGTHKRYEGKYTERDLQKWKKVIDKAVSEGKTAYLYFNNDAGANAPKDAMRFMEMAG